MDTMTAAGSTADVDLDRIIEQLDAAYDKLPRTAIRRAREHRQRIVPKLIEAIRRASADARAGNVPEGNAHFYALFLLTEFKAKEALPVILEAISLPGQLPEELFDDAITETLPRVLAALAGDRFEVLDNLIADRSCNEFVRWSAAETYLYHVRDGRLTRLEAVERLRAHLRQAIDHRDEAIAGMLTCNLADLCPKEALEEITEAFRCELIDSRMIDLESVEESIAHGETSAMKRLARRKPSGMDDTIEELGWWFSFRDKLAEPPYPPLDDPDLSAAPFPLDEIEDLVEEKPLSRGARVGRNESCPCGSGKKFKKCCGSRR